MNNTQQERSIYINRLIEEQAMSKAKADIQAAKYKNQMDTLNACVSIHCEMMKANTMAMINGILK